MEEIRAAFMKGELLGCDEEYCPGCINYNDSLKLSEENKTKPRISLSEAPVRWISKEEMQQAYDSMGNVPLNISLAYDKRCNHACPSCRNGIYTPDEQYKCNLKQITRNIAPYLNSVKSITTNGIGELFVSHEILDMLSKLKPERDDFSIFTETNGVLFKDNWDKLKHLSPYHFTVSVTPNSFHRETYRYLAGKDNLGKFEESMAFISELKQKGDINHIRMIMVIQDSNFRQIPEFIQQCIDYDANDIVLRPIFKWFGLQENEWLYKNILNPCHPYHREYLEILENPICKDKRVYNWGFAEKQEPESFPTMEMKRWFLSSASKLGERLNNLLPFFEKHDNLIIYGAGQYGEKCLVELLNSIVKDKISCVAVTHEDGNKKVLCGIPVSGVDKLLGSREKSAVLIATMPDAAREIHCTLETRGFKHIVELF